VTTRKTFRGTHRGEFLGIAPTGRSISFDAIDVVRIADGRIAEHWNVVDLMGLLQQIGPRPRG
jgi:predicted ester cyclase